MLIIVSNVDRGNEVQEVSIRFPCVTPSVQKLSLSRFASEEE